MDELTNGVGLLRWMRKTVVILALMAFPSILSAQLSGKIAGQIHDKGTGQSLIGVNVVVQGTNSGAASDLNGFYVILNVSPGSHTLMFTYMGYKSVTVKDVVVNIDRTTTINIEMESAAIDLGEVVTVIAQRPIVEADKTSSSVHFQSEDVENLPVTGLRNVLELTAGVNKNADGTISIRGGDGYEINYSVNGIKSMTTNTGATAFGGMNDKGDNSWKYEVNPLAVSQMEVISGGFSSEYGNAQSGVIKVVTKEGGAHFSGGLRVEVRPPGQYHWGDYVYSHDQFEWQNWGNIESWYADPYFQDSTGAVDYAKAVKNYNLWVKNHTPTGDPVLLGSYDSTAQAWVFEKSKNSKNIMGVYDYRKQWYKRVLFSFGGPLGMDAEKLSFFLSGEIKTKPTRLPTVEKNQKVNNFSLVLSYRPNPRHQFKMTNMYQYYYSGIGSGSDDVRWAGLWGSYGAKRKYTLVYDAPREERVLAQSLNYKYLFSSKTFLETSMTHQSEILYVVQVPTPGIEKDAQEVQQGKKAERELEERGSWFENYRDYYTWCSLYNQASITDYYEAKASFSSQVTNSNLFKVGAEAWLMDQDYNASSSETVSSFIWRTGFGTNYKAKTKYAAAYIQDKIEFAGMVANLGVRADAYNFGGKVPVDRYNLFYQAEYEGFPDGIGIPKWYDSKTYVTLSPRIGFSFPISDKTAFRVQYGHFRSMPIIRQALDNQTNHGWGIYGNPNLEPKLSINYEVGLQQNLWGTHQLDVVTYYNDLKNQVSSIYVETSAGSTRTYYDWAKGTYITYDNSGYGTSQGVEITFSNRDVNRLRYRFSYTLSQTTSGNHGVYLYREEMTEDMIQRYSFDATDVLSSEDRTHRFNGSVSYTFPEKSGVKVIGLFPFENVTLGLVYRATSGLGYSWSPDYETDFVVESNRRYPIESSTDLQLEKRIKVEGMNFILNVRILNLFNNKQLTPFTSYDELTRWVKRSVTYEDADDAPNRDYRLYNYFQVYKNIPREVYFTVGLDF